MGVYDFDPVSYTHLDVYKRQEDALASIGVKSVTAKMPQSSVVVDCEAIFQISYEFDRSMDATLTFDIPRNDYSDASAALDTGETLECTSREGALSVKIPSGATSGVISIALTPTKERVYSMPFSLSASGATVPAGNLSFASLGTVSYTHLQPWHRPGAHLGHVQRAY